MTKLPIDLTPLFTKLIECGQDEGQVLRTVFDIIQSTVGKEKAASMGTLLLYPPPDRSLCSEIYTKGGGVLSIIKTQRPAIVWPRLRIDKLKQFDTFVVKTGGKQLKQVLAFSKDQVGPDGRVYPILPQLMHHGKLDFDTWSRMQDLFTYPSPFTPVSSDVQGRIRKYIYRATGDQDCLKSKCIHQNIRAFYSRFAKKSKKRKRLSAVVMTMKQALQINCIHRAIQDGFYRKAFDYLAKYCESIGVAHRVLSALCKDEEKVVADGCIFTIKYEPLPACKFYHSEGKIVPACPAQWNVAMIQDGVVHKVFSAGIAIPNPNKEAIFVTMSEHCPVPQVQVWSNGQFLKPDDCWKAWKKMATKNTEENIYKYFTSLLKRAYPPAKTIRSDNTAEFICKLWNMYICCH